MEAWIRGSLTTILSFLWQIAEFLAEPVDLANTDLALWEFYFKCVLALEYQSTLFCGLALASHKPLWACNFNSEKLTFVPQQVWSPASPTVCSALLCSTYSVPTSPFWMSCLYLLIFLEPTNSGLPRPLFLIPSNKSILYSFSLSLLHYGTENAIPFLSKKPENHRIPWVRLISRISLSCHHPQFYSSLWTIKYRAIAKNKSQAKPWQWRHPVSVGSGSGLPRVNFRWT